MEKGIQFLRPIDFDFGEDFDDICVKIKDIKKGDVFFECEGGCNYKLKALTNARRINDGWYCVVENNKNEKFEMFISDMTKHRGPNLFWEPRFLTKIEKEVVYIID